MTHSAHVSRVERYPRVDDELADALRHARDALDSGQIALVALPAPRAAVDAVLVPGPQARVHWSSPSGDQMAGIGVAVELTASGRERFDVIARAADELWHRTRVSWSIASPPPIPRLFGGFAFQEGRARGALWNGFGEARFVLPEVAYVSDAQRAWLGIAVRRDASNAELERIAQTANAVRARLERSGAAAIPHSAEVAVTRTRQASEVDFGERVGAIRTAIESGQVEKVVAARRSVLELRPAPEPLEVLARLRSEGAACTRFLLSQGDTTFLGATPERLVSKHATSVETEAIAGSSRSEGDAEELLHSAKDLAEHQIVVRELVHCLEPLARSIEVPERAQIQRLNYLMHLRTPVRAELRESCHVLTLVERLHPTPAVGGVPRAQALKWIATHEPDERGWYAGPIGWFDRAGDGEFWVALRSGLLQGTRAHLYVGAGIVAASDPSAEYAETRLKLASLLHALGVVQ